MVACVWKARGISQIICEYNFHDVPVCEPCGPGSLVSMRPSALLEAGHSDSEYGRKKPELNCLTEPALLGMCASFQECTVSKAVDRCNQEHFRTPAALIVQASHARCYASRRAIVGTGSRSRVRFPV